MRNLKYLLYVLSCVMLFHSCLIENDMSYPRVSAEFTAFEVEGQESVTIDNEYRVYGTDQMHSSSFCRQQS